jgi:hypothetical protein
MLLPPEEGALFIQLYSRLIAYVGGKLGGVDGIKDLDSFKAASNQVRANARDRLLENIPLMGAFVKENPYGFQPEDLSLVSDWKRFLRGRFVIERDLKEYTVFLSEDTPPKAYGVVAIFSDLVELSPLPFPAFVTAVLLPWKGRIVCDGFLSFAPLIFGAGLRRSYRDIYREAKERGIITCLDPGWSPPGPKPKRVSKTPAIRRFLKKCPRTVDEFKDRYGEPRMDMGGDLAQVYGVWKLDGAPAIEADHLMLYANIIKDQALYVYAKGGKITHVAVVDPTNWRKKDFKPHKGRLQI